MYLKYRPQLQDNNRAKLHLSVVICSFFIKVPFVNAVTLREPCTRKEVSHGSTEENSETQDDRQEEEGGEKEKTGNQEKGC